MKTWTFDPSIKAYRDERGIELDTNCGSLPDWLEQEKVLVKTIIEEYLEGVPVIYDSFDMGMHLGFTNSKSDEVIKLEKEYSTKYGQQLWQPHSHPDIFIHDGIVDEKTPPRQYTGKVYTRFLVQSGIYSPIGYRKLSEATKAMVVAWCIMINTLDDCGVKTQGGARLSLY